MTLRVGLIGASGHPHYVLKGIGDLPDAALVAMAPGSDDESMARIAAALPAGSTPRTYSGYLDMLDAENLDLVAVNPHFHHHAKVSVAALERGLPVYSEKPLALTLADLAALRQAWEEASVPLGIMFDCRYRPAFFTARKLVRDGAIGTPTVGYSQKSYRFGTRPDFYRRRDTFGGVTAWVGIHAIDWFRWVSGVEYKSVCATHAKLHRPDFPGVEDAVTCMYELHNGGTAVMSFDYLRPQGAPTHGDDRLRLLGDRGAIDIIGDKLTLIDMDECRNPDLVSPPYDCFADFAMSVLDPRHTCLIEPEEAFLATEIALKTRDAGDTGARIDLD